MCATFVIVEERTADGRSTLLVMASRDLPAIRISVSASRADNPTPRFLRFKKYPPVHPDENSDVQILSSAPLPPLLPPAKIFHVHPCTVP